MSPYRHDLGPLEPRSTPAITVPFALASGIVIVAILLIAAAASRSAALPDSPPDVQSSGVPQSAVATYGRAMVDGLVPGPDGGTPSSPAPATGAGSEGAQAPTSSMPATNRGDGCRSGLSGIRKDGLGGPMQRCERRGSALSVGSNPTPSPSSLGSHVASREGFISHMGAGYPRWYLALPCKHGNVRCKLTVRLCGPADCVTIRQTDYGPSQRLFPDRIADVSPWMFERLCGAPASTGTCNGSWTVVTSVPLPATDGGS